MSIELDSIIETCVHLLTSDSKLTREEMSDLLNRWEEMGFINRQMRALIVQRLKRTPTEKNTSPQEPSS